MALWHSVEILEEEPKKRKAQRTKLSEYQKDLQYERRQHTAVLNAEQAPRVAKGSAEGQEAFRKARMATHMRCIPSAKEKPVMTCSAPVRVAAPRIETPNAKLQKFYALQAQLKEKC